MQKFSKAQRAANAKFAAAGRAAQAKARAQPGYKPSKAQRAAYRRFAAAGRRAQHRAALGLPPLKHKAPVAKKQLSPGSVACCSAEAVAASLRLAGGDPSAEDMLELYFRVAAAPGEGAHIPDILAGAAWYGLAGWCPHYWPARPGILTPGTIVGYPLWDGIAPHAITICERGAVSWETVTELPPDVPDEIWQVDWHLE